MSDEVFQQNLDNERGLRPGGPFLIQMLFKEPVAMPGKDEMTAVIEKHIGAVECFCTMIRLRALQPWSILRSSRMAKALHSSWMGCTSFKGDGFDAFLMSQMWDCQEDRERIFQECQYQVVAIDMLAAALPALERANLDADFLDALAELYPTCEAFYFQNCGKLFLAEDVRSHRLRDRIASFASGSMSVSSTFRAPRICSSTLWA